jgi:hypothetical protein
MRHYLNWRDYTQVPEIKTLIENKGVEAARVRYMQEVTRWQYNDPAIITETNVPGLSVPSPNGASAGGSTDFITGFEISSFLFTWQLPLTNLAVSGSDMNGKFIDIESYNGQIDFSARHRQSYKNIRCFITTASAFTATVPDSIDCIITASTVGLSLPHGPSGVHMTSSIAYQWQEAINNQAANAVVAGYTNAIAPSTLVLASTASFGKEILFQNTFQGSANLGAASIGSTTASYAYFSDGRDTFFHEQGAQFFDGRELPYSNMPRRDV